MRIYWITGLIIAGPWVLALLVAFAWWWLRARGHALAGAARVTALIAVVVAVAADILLSWVLMPWTHDLWGGDAVIALRHATPLGAGLVALVIACLPLPRAERGVAEVRRRTPLSFVRRGPLIAVGILVAVVLALTVAAGAASSPDAEGHRTMYYIALGEAEGGTTIYGWYYSRSSLILLAALLVAGFAAVALIARPALGLDAERERLQRRVRSRNVLLLVAGALTLHLSTILLSLAATAGMRMVQHVDTTVPLRIQPDFAALGPLMQYSGYAALVIGAALWLLVAFTALPARGGKVSR